MRAASFAAVAFFAFATIVATDPSLALSGEIATIDSTHSASAPLLPVEPSALQDRSTIFAPRREVVQKTPSAAAVESDESQDAPRSLSELVSAHAMPAHIDRDLHCLAGAVYFESKSEPLEGQLAVAEVIINRAESGRFPGSICSVVFQPGQFSFVRRGGFPPIRTGSRDWEHAVVVAEIAMKDQWESRASEALYFHARRVSPNWGKTRVAQLGNHVFYR